MKVKISRRTTFNAAHRLYNSAWSDEKNNAVFGKCNNPNFHGHNYVLIVSLLGEINQETGYVMDLDVLKKIINDEIIEELDHKNLNLDVEAFRNLNPTVENICVHIFKKLRPIIDANLQLSIQLYETENNFAEVTES